MPANYFEIIKNRLFPPEDSAEEPLLGGNPVRYAETRHSRTPIIFQPDADPFNRRNEESVKVQGRPRGVVGGMTSYDAPPRRVLQEARTAFPQEGSGFREAYDLLAQLLKGKPGPTITAAAPRGAELVNPNIIQHEQGHVLAIPLRKKVEEEALRRFGISGPAATEGLAYAQQMPPEEDPTGFSKPILKILESLSPEEQGLRRYLEVLKRNRLTDERLKDPTPAMGLTSEPGNFLYDASKGTRAAKALGR